MDGNLIEYNGVLFYSECDQKYFNRKRTNRLDKKLRTGKHLSLVMIGNIDHTATDDDKIDTLIDEFLELDFEHKVAISSWSPKKTAFGVVLDNNHKVGVMQEIQHVIDSTEELFQKHNEVAGITHHIIHDY